MLSEVVTQYDLQSLDAHGTQFFDSLAACLDAFIAAWEAEDSPPHLPAYLPKDDPKLIPYALLELVKVDIEYRWSRGVGRTVDEYVSDFPMLETGEGPPPDLIYEYTQGVPLDAAREQMALSAK